MDKKQHADRKIARHSAGEDFQELVYRGVESDVLDYKAPVDWNTLSKQQKAKFVRHALAFANTRGGAIVIGVREDVNGHPSLYEGLNNEQCHSFDPSLVGTYINSHVDPAIDLTVERPEIDGKRYAILLIRPFQDIPHVCTHSIDDEVRSGVFYIRSASASSRPASRAGEMHDLIRRALRNQRDLLGNLLRDILSDQPPRLPEKQTQELFPPEYDESVSYFTRRLNEDLPPDTPLLDLAVMPILPAAAPVIALSELRAAAEKAVDSMHNTNGYILDPDDVAGSYATNVSLRGMNKARDKFWQLFQSGLLHFRLALDNSLSYDVLSGKLAAVAAFAGNFYSQLPYKVTHLAVQLTIVHSENMQLLLPEKSNTPAVCRIDEVQIREKFALSQIQTDSQIPLKKLLNEIKVRFNAPEISPAP